jgi:hypothetical protein
MKKTQKLKARRMWAHPLDLTRDTPLCLLRRTRSKNTGSSYTIPVAVVPLDDVEGLVRKVAETFGKDSGFYEFTPAREALIAIGVLPKQRKKGARK